jgi:hypothetical protein
MDYQEGIADHDFCGVAESFNITYEYCQTTLEMATLKNW